MDYLPIILGLLPSFAWLIFYLKEDPHQEPKKLILETFLAGGLITFLVLGPQTIVSNFINSAGIVQYGFLAFILLASVEEFCKFLAAKTVVSDHKKDFDEPVDAMVYLIVAALGFAAVENMAAVFNAKEVALETTTLRFIGATLLHTISSGLLGYYWARSIIEKKRWLLFAGIIAATLLHTVFNYLILRFEPATIPTAFLIISALFILYDFEKLKHLN